MGGGHLFGNYKALRNRYENLGLLKSLQSLYESLKIFLDSGNVPQAKGLFEKLILEEEQLIKHLIKGRTQLLDELLNETEFNAAFLKGIENITNSLQGFVFAKGTDLVEGTYQHLPIFLNFGSNKNLNEYDDKIYPLIKILFSSEFEDSRNLYDDIRNLITKLQTTKSRGDTPVEERLIKAFISLLLPSDVEKTIRKNDLQIYDWLNKLSREINSSHELISEIWYMLCWIARRIGRYSDSLDFAERGIASFRTDPRFYHGRFLAKYCLYMSNEKQKTFKYISEILDDIEKAYYLYQLYIKEHYETRNANLVLSRIYETFHNNFCFFYVERASLYIDFHTSTIRSKDEFLIWTKIGRLRLEALKKITPIDKRLPEYFATEAYLEYIESFSLKGSHSMSKLTYALKAIERAISLSTNNSIEKRYFERSRLIKERISLINKEMRSHTGEP